MKTGMTTNLKIRLQKEHILQDRLVRGSQSLFRNFPDCIGNMNNDQFGSFYFQNRKNILHGFKGRELSNISIYREDFMPHRETMSFETKP